MYTPRLRLTSLVLAWALGLRCLGAAESAAPAAGGNLLANGGFEEWAALTPEAAQRDDVRNVDLLPPGQAPRDWLPLRELARDHTAHTGSIALDEAIAHSGRRSVRLENRDRRDISVVLTSTEALASQPDAPGNIRPNRRYRVRWWVRGENVDADGAGPILMLYVMSQPDGQWQRRDAAEHGPLPHGSFDWQRREFVFITDQAARWLCINLQLRWTTGRIWYDDVELLDLGPVVAVPTY